MEPRFASHGHGENQAARQSETRSGLHAETRRQVFCVGTDEIGQDSISPFLFTLFLEFEVNEKGIFSQPLLVLGAHTHVAAKIFAAISRPRRRFSPQLWRSARTQTLRRTFLPLLIEVEADESVAAKFFAATSGARRAHKRCGGYFRRSRSGQKCCGESFRRNFWSSARTPTWRRKFSPQPLRAPTKLY